jgi:hypothetical protein
MQPIYITGSKEAIFPFVCIPRFDDAVQDKVMRKKRPSTTRPTITECTACVEKNMWLYRRLVLRTTYIKRHEYRRILTFLSSAVSILIRIQEVISLMHAMRGPSHRIVSGHNPLTSISTLPIAGALEYGIKLTKICVR